MRDELGIHLPAEPVGGSERGQGRVIRDSKVQGDCRGTDPDQPDVRKRSARHLGGPGKEAQCSLQELRGGVGKSGARSGLDLADVVRRYR